jgi:hypothetical protein
MHSYAWLRGRGPGRNAALASKYCDFTSKRTSNPSFLYKTPEGGRKRKRKRHHTLHIARKQAVMFLFFLFSPTRGSFVQSTKNCEFSSKKKKKKKCPVFLATASPTTPNPSPRYIDKWSSYSE